MHAYFSLNVPRLRTSCVPTLFFTALRRQVNVDNNCVGWYKSIHYSSFSQAALVETQFSYQENLSENCVVLLYDPTRDAYAGGLSVKAYQLSDAFVEAKRNKSNDYMPPSSILEELPLLVRNPGLISTFLIDLQMSGAICRGVKEQLLTSIVDAPPAIHVEHMAHCVDELIEESAKFHYHLRTLDRNREQLRYQAVVKRRQGSQDNKEEVPEAIDPKNTNTAAPLRLESLLIANQINEYCNSISARSRSALSAIYLATTSSNTFGDEKTN